MATPDAKAVAEGLAKVAHAVRRSTALHEAITLSEPGTSVEDMLALADRLAQWIGGRGEEREHEQADRPSWQPPS